MYILEVNKLSKKYGVKQSQVTALDNIDLKVKEGEFISIVGPSGSGKSTLLHLLGGIDKPDEGDILINGENIYQLDESQRAVFRRRNIGLVYQFYNLIPTLNTVENIELPCLLDNQKVDRRKLDEILETIGLNNRKDHLPSQLSGGQQQRVSIGRALINQPALILADEPTGNLDSKSSQTIMELLKLANRKYNQTLILITHDMEIARQADRIITMKDGKITKDEVNN